jgi:23S rRNA (adenine2030-N6)-methyltransferase
MIEDLMHLDLPNWLHVEMTIHTPSIEGFGMHGSGLFIVNPPWTLPNILNETMPVLTQLLALDETANYALNYKIA